MPESTLDQLKRFKLADGSNLGSVRVVASGEIKPSNWGMGYPPCYRITNCCGVAMKGKTKYVDVWARNKNAPKAEWDEDMLITIGFAGKTVRPKLGVGREFVRMDSGKRDFIISWRNL